MNCDVILSLDLRLLRLRRQYCFSGQKLVALKCSGLEHVCMWCSFEAKMWTLGCLIPTFKAKLVQQGSKVSCSETKLCVIPPISQVLAHFIINKNRGLIFTLFEWPLLFKGLLSPKNSEIRPQKASNKQIPFNSQNSITNPTKIT